MSDDYKIHVDGGQPAMLNNGAGALTDLPLFTGGCSGLARTAARAEGSGDDQGDSWSGLRRLPD